MNSEPKDLLSCLSAYNIKPVFCDDSTQPNVTELVDLKINHHNIELELHTEKKDKSWGLFSYVYKHIVRSKQRKHFDNLPTSNRIKINKALIEIISITDNKELQAIFMNVFQKCIQNHNESEKYFESVDYFDELKSVYLTIISQRDKKNYFTFPYADEEEAFFDGSKEVNERLTDMFECDYDIYNHICIPILNTYKITKLPESVSGDLKLGAMFSTLFYEENNLSLIKVIKDNIVKDSGLKYFEFELEDKNRELFSESVASPTYHYVDGKIMTNYDFIYGLSEEEKQRIVA